MADQIIDSVRNEEVVEETRVATEVRVPGAAVVTAADRAALDALLAEQAQYAAPAPIQVPEYDGIDTRTPEANLATRSNIVRD